MMMSVRGDIPSMVLSVTQARPCEYRRKNKGRKKKRNKGKKAPRLNYVKKNWNNNFGKNLRK